MTIRQQLGVLPPLAGARKTTRGGRAGAAFSNENLDLLAHVLDDWLRIPGTSMRFGLDAVVGLVPGVGDVLGGLASCVMLGAAWARGVPYVTLARMTVNLGIDVIAGTVPVFGDIFDAAWKANRRNYKLMVRHIEQPRKHTWKDWMFLLGLTAALLAIFALPLIAIGWVIWLAVHYGWL